FVPNVALLAAPSLALVPGCLSSAGQAPRLGRLLVFAHVCLRHSGQGIAPKTLLVERFLLAEHVKDTPRQPRRQDAQRLARAVFLRLPLLPPLGSLTGAEKQTGDLREGPAQMGVADLLAAPAQLLARRLVVRAHQPRVRQELSHLLETSSIVHLVQEHQAQDWSTA